MYTRTTHLPRTERWDARFLRDLELEPASHTAWRFAGYRPSLEEYERDLGAYLRAETVFLRSSGAPIGLVGLTSANPRSGIAYLTLVSSPSVTGHLRMLEATAAFILSAYEDPRIRKIYAEVPDFAWPAFRAGEGRYFHHEGRLVDYVVVDGGFADLHVLAFDRDEWVKMSDRLRARLGLT